MERDCGALGECLLDQNPHVRRAVYKVTSAWLMELRERYSYFHYMLPLILTGLVPLRITQLSRVTEST